jgi:protein involved in polysaccharide export with SLBB domain
MGTFISKTPMKKHLLLFISLLILQFCLSLHALGQEQDDKEKIIQQAQQGIFMKMTPEQIRAKLKELGITEEEAIQKARERNVDLEQYLQRGQQGELQTTQAPTGILPQATQTQVATPEIQPEGAKENPYTVPTEFAKRSGANNLKPFGFDLFQYSVTTFEPNINVPVPPTYVLGPGDEILLNIWGDTQLSYQLLVSRDGAIIIPNVGLVVVNGLTVEKLRAKLLDRISKVYSSLRHGAPNATAFLDLSIGKLRTIQVYVMGEVKRPGVFTLTGMATAFTALYYSGGPKTDGTLREIIVNRNNDKIATIDFYNFAIKGDRSNDVRLQDGDIIYIHSAGPRIALNGKVKHPAIYELKPDERLGDVIQLAGGLQVDADYRRVHVERIIPFEDRNKYDKNILDLDVFFNSKDSLLSTKYEIIDGDVVNIFPIRGELQNRITILGNVKQPGTYELIPGMRVRDIIMRADSLLEATFMERGTIKRILSNLKSEIIGFRTDKAIAGDETDNIELTRMDEVTIYKDTYFKRVNNVSISGSVMNPGAYVRSEKFRLSDLLVLAGGIQENAELTRIEVFRRDTTNEIKYSSVFSRDLPTDYWKIQNNSDFELEDYDHVEVYANPKIHSQQFVNLTGEVRYAGTYAIRYEGERLASIIARAGGFKETAYIEGTRFYRSNNGQRVQVPISLERAIDDTESIDNLSVFNGDELDVPVNKNVIMVSGQVYLPSAVLYKKGASLNYYLRQAGGVMKEAESDGIVVSLPNGSKWEPGWFIFPNPEILAGSSITVPKKIEEKTETLQILRDWAIIIANTAMITIAIYQITK